MEYFPTFVYNQWFGTPTYPDHNFSGQTIIVTGANVGLGFEAARHFTRLHANQVIIACRTTSKGEAARDDIEKSTGRTGVVEVWPLDLGSHESVKAFAKRVSTMPRLDAIVENAGIAARNWKVAEGYEQHINTNVISTFLLALLVLPKLRETATTFNTTPILSIVSSDVHFFAGFEEKSASSIFDALNNEKTAKINDRYPTSKLIEIMYVRELAKALDKSTAPKIILNTLNPGLCHSNLTTANNDTEPSAVKILKLIFARTTEVGSRTLVAAACAGSESHGQYMANGNVAIPSKFVRSPEGAEIARSVWTQLNERLEKINPGVTKNI